ncbi:M10 family metallopeptidase C-terminal domain-containing protein [uncultured Cohaesibacter sp.]|uniref:M10 family metallopeptidase C-terminal domain-containing protein n=1 Tax=uncultured Cohaesibacter sp. TaxID=1002546 RepID=UPI0029C87F18|nr:M10 family metallopeptidase C-terminal domain-containing protein [uncultured Cohaesibacter sp.]
MAVKIDIPTGMSDWVSYLENTWLGSFSYDGHGSFSAYAAQNYNYGQWVAGNVNTTQSAVLMDGDFSYGPPGGFSGDVDSLQFGDNLTGSSGSGYTIDTELTLDLTEASATTAFTYAIYYISNLQNLSYLYNYLGEQGTEQTGNSGDDSLYSFSGDDILTGGGASDYDLFVFDAAYASTSNGWGDDTITDFVDGQDEIDFIGYWSDYASFDADTTITTSGTDTVISYTDSNSVTSTITLANFSGTLDSGDFYFA